MYHLALLMSSLHLAFAASSSPLSIVPPVDINGPHQHWNGTIPSPGLNSTRFGAIFPPGWPEHNYIYHVPLSSITLECFGFTIQAELDSQIVYNLLARAWRPFANPAQRRLPAARIRHDLDGFWWEEEAQDESFTYLHILLPTEPKLDYGQMADTIAGMLQIAIDYPHITIHCRAQDEYDGGLQVIALPNLAWSEPEGATAR